MPPVAAPPPHEGLRDRKKRLTRELISSTATRMFLADGFDAVKVTDIARACDVAEKTVYNYFPTKEALLLDRGDEMVAAVRRAFGPGATRSLVDAALDLLAEQLESILSSVPGRRRGITALAAFVELLGSTQSLRAAQHDLDTRLVGVAAQAIADRAGVSPDEPEVQIAAQTLVGLWRIQFAALRRYTAQRVASADVLRENVTADVVRAARLVDCGLWSLSSAVVAPGDRARLTAAEASAHRNGVRVWNIVRRARADVR